MGWSNVAASVIEVNTVIVSGTVGSGIFVYDGTPATGNLIGSIAAGGGTDAYGNTYLAGFTSYDPAGKTFTSIINGAVEIGAIVAGVPDVNDSAELIYLTASGGNPYVQISSPLLPAPSSYQDAALIELFPGFLAQGQTGVNLPAVVVADDNASSAAQIQVSGAVVKTSLNGATPFTWQIPTVNAVLTRNGFANELGMQYRLDAEDNLVIAGAVQTVGVIAANTDTTVFTLPPAYRPKAGMRWAIYQSTGSGVVAFMIVQTGGAVIIMNTTATVAGTVFETTAALIPMGNIS